MEKENIELYKENASLKSNVEDLNKKISKQIGEISTLNKQINNNQELMELADRFVDEFSAIDLGETCSDDPEHGSKVKQANAFLDTIEMKARMIKSQETLDFVSRQRSGYRIWRPCKSEVKSPKTSSQYSKEVAW